MVSSGRKRRADECSAAARCSTSRIICSPRETYACATIRRNGGWWQKRWVCRWPACCSWARCTERTLRLHGTIARAPGPGRRPTSSSATITRARSPYASRIAYPFSLRIGAVESPARRTRDGGEPHRTQLAQRYVPCRLNSGPILRTSSRRSARRWDHAAARLAMKWSRPSATRGIRSTDGSPIGVRLGAGTWTYGARMPISCWRRVSAPPTSTPHDSAAARMRARSTRTARIARTPAGCSASFVRGLNPELRLVHPEIREAVCVLVEFAPHVLELHLVELGGKQSRAHV